jgi:Arc/MetJ family transcription regulator
MRATVTLDDNLLQEAQRLTGLTQPKDLIQEGLKALIARETTRRLGNQNRTCIEDKHSEAQDHD